jgi:mono/diheme cytochrome c family protein
MIRILNIGLALVASIGMISCSDTANRNYQYMPNMYEPVSYETYGAYEIFFGEQAAMLPAEGSIPRGWKPYEYANTTEGLNLAKTDLKNALNVTDKNLSEGKKLYDIYCALCHGEKGDGQGILVKREKMLGIPSYDDPGRIITEGGVYHVQMYGLNSMGSYASQTNELERWQITMYVMNLKATLAGTPLLTPQVAATVEEAAVDMNESAGSTSEEQH